MPVLLKGWETEHQNEMEKGKVNSPTSLSVMKGLFLKLQQRLSADSFQYTAPIVGETNWALWN